MRSGRGNFGCYEDLSCQVSSDKSFQAGLSRGTSDVDVDQWLHSPDLNPLLTLPGLGYVVGSLHPHEGVHLYSEGFFHAKRHVPGQIGFAVEEA